MGRMAQDGRGKTKHTVPAIQSMIINYSGRIQKSVRLGFVLSKINETDKENYGGHTRYAGVPKNRGDQFVF